MLCVCVSVFASSCSVFVGSLDEQNADKHKKTAQGNSHLHAHATQQENACINSHNHTAIGNETDMQHGLAVGLINVPNCKHRQGREDSGRDTHTHRHRDAATMQPKTHCYSVHSAERAAHLVQTPEMPNRSAAPPRSAKADF